MLSSTSYVCFDEGHEAQVIGEYRIGDQLGEGSFATVYKAEHTTTGNNVAVKVFGTASDESVSMSDREVVALRRVSSLKSVSRFVDLIDDASLAGRFIFMDYAGTQSLQDLVNAHPHVGLPVAEVRRIGRGLLETLAACHAKGVAHGDVKLNNVMITPSHRRPSPVLIDFGSAVIDGGDPDGELGAPAFRPPESFMEDWEPTFNAACLVDAWGAGLCIYCMATGAYPFEGDSIYDVIRAITEADMTGILDTIADVPLRAMLAGLLAPAPTRWTAGRAAASGACDGWTRKLARVLGCG